MLPPGESVSESDMASAMCGAAPMDDNGDAFVNSFFAPDLLADSSSAVAGGLLSSPTMAGVAVAVAADPTAANDGALAPEDDDHMDDPSLSGLSPANDIPYHSTSTAIPASGTVTNIATAAAASAMDCGHSDPSAIQLPLQSSASVPLVDAECARKKRARHAASQQFRDEF